MRIFWSLRQPTQPVRDLNRAKFLSRSSHRSATSNSAIKGPWTIGDICVFGFTLSLVLLGTILSAYTDRPVFWLLVGPGPIAIGFTLITFLRQGFGRPHGLSVVEKRGRSGGHSNKVVGSAGHVCGENESCTITVRRLSWVYRHRDDGALPWRHS